MQSDDWIPVLGDSSADYAGSDKKVKPCYCSVGDFVFPGFVLFFVSVVILICGLDYYFNLKATRASDQ